MGKAKVEPPHHVFFLKVNPLLIIQQTYVRSDCIKEGHELNNSFLPKGHTVSPCLALTARSLESPFCPVLETDRAVETSAAEGVTEEGVVGRSLTAADSSREWRFWVNDDVMSGDKVSNSRCMCVPS